MPPKVATEKKEVKEKGGLLSKSQLKGIKTCADHIKKDVDTMHPSHVTGSKFNAPAMRAAFLKGKILRAFTVLKCAFLTQPPDDIIRTPTGDMQTAVDANGVSIPLDPLQVECDSMDVIPAIIKAVTTRLQPIVNVKFSFYDDSGALWNPNVADVRIAFDPNGGAWSLLGKDILAKDASSDKTKATMNLGWFDVPTTLHEFCHTLGMTHEHQNPNGVPINWNVDRVHQWAKESQGWDEATTDTNVIKKYSKDQINGSDYDPRSIMLYFFPSTLVNDESGNCCGAGTQQNLRFSPYDVLFLNKIYPTKGQNLQPEDFTVKFFSDNFNEQISVDDLKNQVKKNDEQQAASTMDNDGNSKTGGTGSASDDSAGSQTGLKKKKKEHFEPQQALKPLLTNGSKENYHRGYDHDEDDGCGCDSSWQKSHYMWIGGLVFLIILILIIIFMTCGKNENKDKDKVV